MNTERHQLIDDLKRLSVQKGKEFTLASGQKSDIYVDVKKTMLYGPAMHNLAQLLCQQTQHFGWPHAVAGVPLGGAHLATMIAMYRPPLNVILIRKEVKDHGTQQLVEAPFDPIFRKVILVEDVITTGQSAITVAQTLEDYGYGIRGIVAVVDRRPEKAPTLGDYGFRAVVDFEELI